MIEFFRSLIRTAALRRRARVLRVVDQVPLLGGGAVHVVDVGHRRLVFATSSGRICLLAQFDGVTMDAGREEATCAGV